MRSEARVHPSADATTVLDDEELKVLRVAGRKSIPERPTVADVESAIAALGGHLKHNGPPGWLTLSRGYTKLRTLAEGWRMRRSIETGACC